MATSTSLPLPLLVVMVTEVMAKTPKTSHENVKPNRRADDDPTTMVTGERMTAEVILRSQTNSCQLTPMKNVSDDRGDANDTSENTPNATRR